MSGFITNSGENYLLDLVTGAMNAHPVYYIALITNEPPTQFISGFDLDEPQVADYTRASVLNIPGNWTPPSGEIANLDVIEFSIAEEDWGIIRHYAICDSQEGGEVLWAGDFEIPVTIEEGDQLIIHPGALVIRATTYRSRVEM